MENSGSPSQRVADNVRRLRKARGWSLQDLSDRLAESGVEIGVNSLSKLEREQRKIDVDEFAALADVLGVQTDRLRMPGAGDAVVEALETQLVGHERRSQELRQLRIQLTLLAADAERVGGALLAYEQDLRTTVLLAVGLDPETEYREDLEARATVQNWAYSTLSAPAAERLLNATGFHRAKAVDG